MLTLRRLLLSVMVSGLMLGAADATGKWSGTVEIVVDGQSRSEPAFLILKQDGATLTGSGGPREQEQHALRNGKVEGDKVTFEIARGENEDRVMRFNLTITGDSIDGEVSAPAKDGGQLDRAKLSLKRVKAS